MPDLRFREVHLPEVHLPELHLPEMTRDDIVRAVGDARRDLDLSRFDPRRLELPDVQAPKFDLSKLDMPKVDVSKIDLPRTVHTAAQAAGLVRARRSRTPFILGGLVTLAVVGFALATSPVLRPRLEAMARRARQLLDERRAAWGDHEPVAMGDLDDAPSGVDAAMVESDRVGIDIEPNAFSDGASTEMAVPGPDEAVRSMETTRT